MFDIDLIYGPTLVNDSSFKDAVQDLAKICKKCNREPDTSSDDRSLKWQAMDRNNTNIYQQDSYISHIDLTGF